MKHIFDRFRKPGELEDKNYNWFFHAQRYLSFWISLPFIYLPFSPNLITLLTNLIQITGLTVVVIYDGNDKLYGLLIYFIGGIFDFIDGNIARYKGLESLKGIFYDQIGHVFVGPIFFVSAALSAYFETRDVLFLYASTFLAMFVPLMSYQIANIRNYIDSATSSNSSVPTSGFNAKFLMKRMIALFYHYKIELFAISIFLNIIPIFVYISCLYFFFRFFIQLYLDQKKIIS